MDGVKNITKMYRASDHHVHVLAASIRHLDHLLCSFALNAELASMPGKVLELWAAQGTPLPDDTFVYRVIDSKGQALRPIEFKELDPNGPWESFEVRHVLTKKGIEKLVADYEGNSEVSMRTSKVNGANTACRRQSTSSWMAAWLPGTQPRNWSAWA